MRRLIHALAAMGAALVFGCGGIPADEGGGGATDDEAFCRSGDLAACAIERRCSAGNDPQACVEAGLLGPDDSPGPVEGGSKLAGLSYDGIDHPGPETGGEIGSAQQGFRGTMLWGWETNVGGSPGFMDEIINQGAPALDECGAHSGLTCIYPKGPDLKAVWKWRWERGFAGSGSPSCGNLNGNDDFLIGARKAFTRWSTGTGFQFQEVTSGEDITIFCDEATIDRFDPKHSTAAFFYPFGPPTGPMADILHSELVECSGHPEDGSFISSPGPAYLYSAAGIALSPKNMVGTATGSWAFCSGFNTNPNAIVNMGENLIAHELMHLLGFVHFNAQAWTRSALTCSAVINSTGATLPTGFKNTLANYVSRKQVEILGFPSSVGANVDHQLLCGNPDFTVGIEP